jgi:hypothetical protein
MSAPLGAKALAPPPLRGLLRRAEAADSALLRYAEQKKIKKGTFDFIDYLLYFRKLKIFTLNSFSII